MTGSTAGARLLVVDDEPTINQALTDRLRAEGYAIQAQLGDDADLYGWKIAATSVAGQQHINVSGPIAGRMFADTVIADGGACSLAGNAFRLAEPEFAFRMARDLPPRETPYSVDEVLAAVATLHPAIELPDSRYENVVEAGEAQIIADMPARIVSCSVPRRTPTGDGSISFR